MKTVIAVLFIVSLSTVAGANSKREAIKFAKAVSGNYEVLPDQPKDCPATFKLTQEEGEKGYPTLALDAGFMQARRFYSLNGPKERENDDFGTYSDHQSILEKSVAMFQLRPCEGLVIIKCAKWETAFSLTAKDETLETQGFGIFGDYSGFPDESCRFKKASEPK